MKLSKQLEEWLRKRLYGTYTNWHLHKVNTFEEYLWIRKKLIKAFVVNRHSDSIKNMKG